MIKVCGCNGQLMCLVKHRDVGGAFVLEYVASGGWVKGQGSFSYDTYETERYT